MLVINDLIMSFHPYVIRSVKAQHNCEGLILQYKGLKHMHMHG